MLLGLAQRREAFCLYWNLNSRYTLTQANVIYPFAVGGNLLVMATILVCMDVRVPLECLWSLILKLGSPDHH
jgi:hypothetical protein